ncbi:BC1872 family protein [Desulfosporosinus nitroreducens]|uniref:BC1872 family protein n=1 Tax=Desulfosporosinus nitroreducens TaxID=2018668 RepID=UPI00207C7261|nr:hypothetical protein [Desulfosporosinus nitroreducens]MCO1599866.1 hypothetical protein [Desulfosporosinus nitroreducens]
MTKAEILAMKPGPELDELVGKLMGATPVVKWYAMNKNETAYFMDFECRRLAQDWHVKITGEYKNHRYSSDGGHIVRKEFYRQYSADISAAMEILESSGDQFFLRKTPSGKYAAGFLNISSMGDTAPEAICKAALLAKMEVTT